MCAVQIVSRSSLPPLYPLPTPAGVRVPARGQMTGEQIERYSRAARRLRACVLLPSGYCFRPDGSVCVVLDEPPNEPLGAVMVAFR